MAMSGEADAVAENAVAENAGATRVLPAERRSDDRHLRDAPRQKVRIFSEAN
jgi:hypothetical protein